VGRRIKASEIAYADQKLRRIAVAVDAMIADAPPLTGDRVTDQLLLVQKAVIPTAGILVDDEDELDMAIISIAAELLHRRLR